jgi:uncharacterized hydrophobic protein (TIGR00271 family)
MQSERGEGTPKGTRTIAIFRLWRARISLAAGSDIQGTEQRLRDGAGLSPENLWLLACSALLASIGLDQDSVAVLIGAMLISPLMGPILAVGFGVAIFDQRLLARAMRELALATVASIALSAVYFWLSPLAQPTVQLIARTRPTLLDVGVAFFGGAAGIIAGSRRTPSLALPGVAIATALMPPLCTAGFGLATGRGDFFFGGLYLFLLNAIFIAVATLAVVRALHFPQEKFVIPWMRRRAHRLVLGTVVVAATPSLFFLYQSAIETRDHQRAERFINRRISSPNRAVIRWEFVPDSSGRELRVYITGRPMERPRLDSLSRELPALGLKDVSLHVLQSELSASDLTRIRTDAVQGVMHALAKSKARQDSATRDTRAARVNRACREMAVVFPEVTRAAFVAIPNALLPPESAQTPAVVLRFKSNVSRTEKRRVLERANAWLRLRLPTDTLEVRDR